MQVVKLPIPPSHFQRPSKIIVSGPSMSGKSTIVKYILDNKLITPPPKSVYWISEGPVPEKNIKYNYHEGGFPESDFLENLTDAAIILDDCQVTASDSDIVSKLFRRLSHHNRLIIFLIVQNLSFAGRRALDVRRNCDYYILFQNTADREQYQRFQSKFGITKQNVSLNYMLQYVTKHNPHHCLITDLKYHTPELLRFRCDPRYQSNGHAIQAFIAVRGSDKAQLSGTGSLLPATDSDSPSANITSE